MNKIYILILLSGYYVNAQDGKGVERSLFGIQTGFLGVWGHNEARISEDFVLRSEAGLNFSFGMDELDTGTVTVLYPNVALSSRYYYNLQKRQNLDRNTYNNASDYLEFKIGYIPDWFAISSSDQNITETERMIINLLWGIKRNIGKHLTYEAGAGLRYSIEFLKQYGIENNSYDILWDIHLRLGYSF